MGFFLSGHTTARSVLGAAIRSYQVTVATFGRTVVIAWIQQAN